MRRLPAALAALAAAVLVTAGCASPGPGDGITAHREATATPTVTAPATSPSAVTPPSTATAAPRYPADWKLPDRRLSPGAVLSGYTLADICPHVNPVLEAMRPTTAEKEAVYRAYGITAHPAGKYEIDHIVPVELLGLVGISSSWPAQNLYPELNDTPDPAMIRKYHLSAPFVLNSKDVVEDVLHQKVCAGTVLLPIAQKALETDWRAAYVKYVGKPPGQNPAPRPAASTPAAPRAPPSSTHAAVAATAKAAPPAACHPVSSGGNCYRRGEFCPEADHGLPGIAGNGETITCELSGSRWRWE